MTYSVYTYKAKLIECTWKTFFEVIDLSVCINETWISSEMGGTNYIQEKVKLHMNRREQI